MTLPRLHLPDALYSAIWSARKGRTVPEVIVLTLEARFLGRAKFKPVNPVPSRPLLEWVTVLEEAPSV